MLTPVNVGDVLVNKYRVERVLGVGGMGMVVAARHLDLDELVALKFMLTNENADIAARFLREARAAVRLKGEHVARVLDVGRLEGEVPYIVMEYLDGHDLSSVLSKQGAIQIEIATEWILQACTALAEAHSLGIVHRDLKPANLFLTRRPDGSASVKILDFGISKVMGSIRDAAVTRTTDVMGSPLYMAPEQMQSSRDVDARADIWALGVILYELVSGAVPFSGETLPQVCVSVMSSKPKAISSRRTGLPAGFDAVVSRCLEKDKADRYQSVAELAQALAPFGGRRGADLAERTVFVSSSSARASQVSYASLEPASVAATTAPRPQIIENEDSGGEPVRIVTPPPGAVVKTNVTWASGSGDGRSKKGLVGAVVVLGAFVLAGAGILIGRASGPKEDVAPATAAEIETERPALAEPTAPATAAPPTATASSSATAAAQPAPTSAPTVAPSVVPVQPPAATYVPGPPPAAKPPPKPAAPPAKPTGAPGKPPAKAGGDDDLYSTRK